MTSRTPAAPTVEDLAATYEALRSELGQIDGASPDAALAGYLRERLQLAAVQLAVAAVRRAIPAAASLVLHDGDDGQGQGGWEILMILGSDGSVLQSVSLWAESAWSSRPVAGGKSPSPADLAWSISLNDDTWAEGIAEIQRHPISGKRAVIDIDAALSRPAPKRPGRRGPLIAQLQATQDVLDIMREQMGQAEDAHRLASVRLAAATILERFPDAVTMKLVPESSGSGRLQVGSITGTNGAIYTSGWNGTDVVDGRGEDGTPSLNELICDLGWDVPQEDAGPVRRHPGHIIIDLPAVRGPVA